jgi:hypothetical protein
VESPSDPADGLRIIGGGLAFVRQHPQMFRHLAHDAPAAAALFVEVALRRSARRIEVLQSGPWHSVSAEIDWLSGLGDLDPFVTVIPFPALGPNAIYPEVIVAAFSTALTTVANGEVRVVHGQEPDLDSLAPKGYASGRTVVFRFDPPIDI